MTFVVVFCCDRTLVLDSQCSKITLLRPICLQFFCSRPQNLNTSKMSKRKAPQNENPNAGIVDFLTGLYPGFVSSAPASDFFFVCFCLVLVLILFQHPSPQVVPMARHFTAALRELTTVRDTVGSSPQVGKNEPVPCVCARVCRYLQLFIQILIFELWMLLGHFNL